MVKKKVRRSRRASGPISHRKHANRKPSQPSSKISSPDISNQTLMVMIFFVLVVSLLSIGLYVYTWYHSNLYFNQYYAASVSNASLNMDKGSAMGKASIQIIEPPSPTRKWSE